MTSSAIRVFPVEPDNGESIAVAGAALRADEAVRNPGDPAMGPQELDAALFRPAPDRQRAIYAATVDGEAAGVVFGWTESDPDDELQVASVDTMVLPAYRRRGVAHALVAAVVPALQKLGQTSIMAYSCNEIDLQAGEAMCRHYGLTKRQHERCSRVPVADIDDELMRSWIAEGEEAADGYRIESWVDQAPEKDRERLIGLWCQAGLGMADAPLDDIDYNYPTRAFDAQLKADAVLADAGFRLVRSVAVAPNGEAAGLSDLMIHGERPHIGHQGDTTVVANHRGKRLGRWLKAANYLHALAHIPDLGVLETYNAQSNSHMLDINVAMGFAPHRSYVGWQGPINDVLAAINGR